ncbi:helix-turn-helix domain-containing protein [Rhodobacteraceae bacterium F11138]|nr:helix-turn-helix domain-containing protein [Rhodobacteraceae bacterium F11138]
MFSIGEMARRTGVKVPTIRFYEQKGLLPEPERTAGNQRRYSKAALGRLGFIRHARDLGLPLPDIAALISLEGAKGDALDRAHDIARIQRDAVRRRIARLQSLERELSRIATACDGRHDHVCAVLDAFSEHDRCLSDHYAAEPSRDWINYTP